ncbi:MAG TPA: SpoIIE family protein phosphatase, partial [Flavobacteriales bacterium]|nr:SpoIIE family protein phosphatase [Flavobacteriales bacterium]
APAALLGALREGIITTLNIQEEVDATRDGMNVSVVSIDHTNGTVSYAGAYAPIYHVRGSELIEYKGDRMPVGFQEGGHRPFAETTFQVQPGDRIYLFSDGLQDQFGGPDGKKLKSSGLKQWITATSGLSMDDQHQSISDRFRVWKGSEEQVDDVLLIGIEL